MSLDRERQSWDFAAERYLAAPERVEQGKNESFPAYQARVKNLVASWLDQVNSRDKPCISADKNSKHSAVDLLCSLGGNRRLRIMFPQLPTDPDLLTMRVPFAEARWQSADIPVSGADDDGGAGRGRYTQPILHVLLRTLRLPPAETSKWLGALIFYRFRGEYSILAHVVDSWSRSRTKFDWKEFSQFIETILSPDRFLPDAPMPRVPEDGLPDTQLGALALALAASMSTSHAQVYVAEGLVDWIESHPEFLSAPIPMDNRRLAAECRVHDRTFPMEGTVLADLFWPVLAEVRNITVFNDEQDEIRASLRDQRFLEAVYDNGGTVLDSLENLFARGSRAVAQIERWLEREGAEFSLCERHREHQVRQSLRPEEGARGPEPYL